MDRDRLITVILSHGRALWLDPEDAERIADDIIAAVKVDMARELGLRNL